MTNAGKGTFQPESDVHITFEDQQKINKFARQNAKFEDLKDELKVKQNDIKNLEEAADEIQLLDDTEKIPYLVGEVFVGYNISEAVEKLEGAKTKKEEDIVQLEKDMEVLKSQMAELKAHLYSKFGSHINLEREDD